MEEFNTLGELSGLDFSPGYLLGSFVFGVIGFYLFRAGKKRLDYGVMGVGGLLMVYPLFVDGASMIWVVGAGLSALAYYLLKRH